MKRNLVYFAVGAVSGGVAGAATMAMYIGYQIVMNDTMKSVATDLIAAKVSKIVFGEEPRVPHSQIYYTPNQG